MIGLHLGHSRADMLRALLEATGFAVRHNLEVMAGAGDSVERIVAVGGGTRRPVWTSVVSDITGLRQELPRHTVGASYGDALLAAVAAGVVEPDAGWNPIEATIEPDQSHRETYDHLYEIYRQVYADTRESVHRLSAFQATQGGPTGG